MDVFGEWFTRLSANGLDGWASLLLVIFTQSVAIPTEILQLDIVRAGILYAQKVATGLLVLFGIFQGYKVYTNYQAGELDTPPGQLVIRVLVALVLIWTIPWTVTQVLNIGNAMAADVAALDGSVVNVSEYSDDVNDAVVDTVKLVGDDKIREKINLIMPIVTVLITLTLAVSLVIITFQMAKRSYEVVILTIIGPIFSVSLSGNDNNLFKTWSRQLFSLAGTQALQVLALRLVFWMIAHPTAMIFGGGNMPLMAPILTIAALIATITIPHGLQKFTHQTGNGGSMSGAITSLASTAINAVARK